MFGFLFSPQGRVSRKGIWLFLLGCFAAQFVAITVDIMLGLAVPPGGGPAAALMTLVLFWPSLAVAIKRFHDRNMSGWWVLLPLAIAAGGLILLFAIGAGSVIASVSGQAAGAEAEIGAPGLFIAAGLGWMLALIGVGIFQIVQLYFLPGTPGPNDHGEDPRAPGLSIDVDFDGGDIFKSVKQARPASEPVVAPAARGPANRLPEPDWGFGRMHASVRGRAKPA